MAILLKWFVASPHSCLPSTLSTSTQASICLRGPSMPSIGLGAYNSSDSSSAAYSLPSDVQHSLSNTWRVSSTELTTPPQRQSGCSLQHELWQGRLCGSPGYGFGLSKTKAVQNDCVMCHCRNLYRFANDMSKECLGVGCI